MKVVTKTLKRANAWKTEYRIESVYFDTYGTVGGIIEELNDIVAMFPEELRDKVMMDMDSDSSYASFYVEGPASKADADKAKAKEKSEKTKWLASATQRRAELDAQIAKVSKEVGSD